jgi:hypothetical protein
MVGFARRIGGKNPTGTSSPLRLVPSTERESKLSANLAGHGLNQFTTPRAIADAQGGAHPAT